jgi:phosphatidylserine/phosphatidylglycerophosphate/cardiolipin synthase-like enzyme
LDKIRELDSIVFRTNPDKGLLDDIVLKIDNAKKRIYLEVYIFTDKRIREAIIKAKNR